MKTDEELLKVYLSAWDEIDQSDTYKVIASSVARRALYNAGLRDAAKAGELEYFSSDETDGHLCEGDLAYNRGVGDVVAAIRALIKEPK